MRSVYAGDVGASPSDGGARARGSVGVMPSKLRGPCRWANTCTERAAPGKRYCEQHQADAYRAQDARRDRETVAFYKSALWLKRAKYVIELVDPICRECQRAASQEVDHITPRADGGSDDVENLQGLCKPCHSAKTMRELHRALPRAR